MALLLSRAAKIRILGKRTGPADYSFRTLCGSSATYYFDMIICKGVVPSSPSAVVDSGDILVTYADVQFGDAAVVSGDIVALPFYGSNWDAAATATGTAAFFRLFDNAAGDDGYADDTSTYAKVRIQGTIGETAGYELVMSDTYIVSGNVKTLDSFNIVIA